MLIKTEGLSGIQSRFKNILKLYLQIKIKWGNPIQSSCKVEQNKVKSRFCSISLHITILQCHISWFHLEIFRNINNNINYNAYKI